MKYLVYTVNAGFDLDDPEDMYVDTNMISFCNNEEEIIKIADQEIKDYIDDELDCRFDTEDPEQAEEIEKFRNQYETCINYLFIAELNKPVQVGGLYLDNGYNFECLKVYAVKLEN